MSINFTYINATEATANKQVVQNMLNANADMLSVSAYVFADATVDSNTGFVKVALDADTIEAKQNAVSAINAIAKKHNVVVATAFI